MKKKLITLVQIAATVALLGWLFRDSEQNRQMLDALSRANISWIAAAFVLFGLVELSAVVRWQVLLRVQGVNIGWLRLSALLMIGVFFNPFMPGGTGGDVVKIYYLLKEVPQKKAAAMLAVLMDRLMGLLGLIIIAGMVIAARYEWLTTTKETSLLLYALLAIFGGCVAFVVVSFAITGFGLVHKLPERMPMRDKLIDLSVAYNHYGRAWRSSLLALALSFPVHLGSFSLFYCVAKAFSESGKGATLLNFWGIMPIVNTLTSVPVTIGGAGLREGLFIKLLGDLCGISESIAKLISLTGYSVVVLWGMIGGITYLFYRPSAHAKLGEIREDVAEVEHEIAAKEELAESVAVPGNDQ
ncbi:MAG: lysylphosphatidylglycerol synthase transmembrane domain-containing protein [Verrucomicrobiota bacterium]